ncbi:MAG: SseB family protein [Armatimonadota bacterium]|nr:SseB family protein [Armatimonadota bacterium]
MWPFGKRHKEESDATVALPVNLDKPVENPQLRTAVEQHAQAPTTQTGLELIAQLNQANYLVAYFPDEVKTTPGKTPGHVQIEEGNLFKMPSCIADGNDYLPLFTDWDQIKAWLDQPVSTLVMPAAQAWDWVLKNSYDGAVINPAGNAVPLNRQQVEELLGLIAERANPLDQEQIDLTYRDQQGRPQHGVRDGQRI